MIKKLKIGLLISVLSLAVGVGSAYASSPIVALTFTNNTNITIGAYTYMIKAGSAVSSIVNNNTDLVVVVPTGSTFSLVSANRNTLSNEGATTTCTNTESTITITGAGDTSTITPSATACGAITSGNGGGNVTPVVTVVTTTVTPTTTTISGCEGRTTGFSTVNGLSCSGSTTTITTTTPVVIPGCNGTTGFSTVNGVSCAGNTGTVTTTTSYNLGTFTLRNGSNGDAVVQLQKLLNKLLRLGLIEDGKLGPKTIAVIKQWQRAHGLLVDGLVGAKTKAAMIAEAGNN